MTAAASDNEDIIAKKRQAYWQELDHIVHPSKEKPTKNLGLGMGIAYLVVVVERYHENSRRLTIFSSMATISVPFSGPSNNKVRKKRVLIETKSDPWALYLYTIKSPPTKEKYSLRLRKFLDSPLHCIHQMDSPLHCIHRSIIS
jgi:hypothetical protein